MKRPLLICATLAVLAGCAQTPAPYHGKNYGAAPPLRMNVAAILVDSEYQMPSSAPNVDQYLQPSIEDMLRQNISQHYIMLREGKPGAATLRFIIKDASITKTNLPVPENWFERTFSGQPEFRYTGHLVVDAEANGPGTHRAGFVHAESSRSLEVGHLDAGERGRQVKGMAQQMIDEVMEQLDQQINDNLGSFAYGDGTQDTTVTPQPSGRWDRVMEWK